MTFYKYGDFTMTAAGQVEKQKWVYDAKAKTLKLTDLKDKSVSGVFKIMRLEVKELVLFLQGDEDLIFLSYL